VIRATERLEDDLKVLRVVVDELRSANKRLQLEWTETYDKVRHQLSRMARRGDLSSSTVDAPIPPETPTEEVETVDPISKKILDRRNRGLGLVA